MSEAAANPWELFARQSRDMLESQAALARTWLDGQTKRHGRGAERGCRKR